MAIDTVVFRGGRRVTLKPHPGETGAVLWQLLSPDRAVLATLTMQPGDAALLGAALQRQAEAAEVAKHPACDLNAGV